MSALGSTPLPLYYCVSNVASNINLRCCLKRQDKQEALRHAVIAAASSLHISLSDPCFVSLMVICTPTLTGRVIGKLVAYFKFLTSCDQAYNLVPKPHLK